MFAVRRKEKDNILHCRFCKCREGFGNKLYETFPNKGIVCKECLSHLESYVESFELRKEPSYKSKDEQFK